MTENSDLLNKLDRLAESDFYPCHMPGHKRRHGAETEPLYRLDITEIDGFDDLHDPSGILKAIQDEAAALYGARECYMSVNGSTGAILAAVFAASGCGEKIIIPRGCHRSVYHGVCLRQLEPVFVPVADIPAADGVMIPGRTDAEDIEKLLDKNPDCRCVLITSPTYEGIVSDIKTIADTVHSHNAVLIADQAHGAHFGFSGAVPESASALGADLVIVSLHKTLPCMTQTALLLNCSDAVPPDMLRRYMKMFITSSPSYVLMASIREGLNEAEKNGPRLLAGMAGHSAALKKATEACRFLKVSDVPDDPGKILVCIRPGYRFCAAKDITCGAAGAGKGARAAGSVLSGRELYDIFLEKYHIQMEMAAENYVLAIMTMSDTEEGWQRLEDAVRKTDSMLCEKYADDLCADIPCEDRRGSGSECGSGFCPGLLPEAVMKLNEAWDMQREYVQPDQAAGRVCADFICLYPPGTPILVPGELISGDTAGHISTIYEQGLNIQGLSSGGLIPVCLSVNTDCCADLTSDHL